MPQRYERELLTRINEVLHYLWDPIGVRGEPHARNEYDAYVPEIYSLIHGSASAEQIAAHLEKIETERMGLGSKPELALAIAHTLLEWRAVLLEKRPEILE